MISFRRATAEQAPAAASNASASQESPAIIAAEPEGPGTRTGAGGTCVSTGCSDLDKLIGNGLPLGSLLVVFEDSWGRHADTLLRYYLAEGTACQHQMLHVMGPHNSKPGLVQRLPKLVQPGSMPAQEAAQAKEDHSGLRIAWQYKRYAKAQTPQQTPQSRSTFTRHTTSHTPNLTKPKLASWAHNYDLSKECQKAVMDSTASTTRSTRHAADRPLTDVVRAVKDFVSRVDDVAEGRSPSSAQAPTSGVTASLPTYSPKSVGRIALESVAGLDWAYSSDAENASAWLSLLYSVQSMLRSSRCTALVTVPGSLRNTSFRNHLVHLSSIAMTIRSVADDSELVRLSTEPQSCCGLLSVDKFTLPGHLPMPKRGPMLSMMRHRRTRISIAPIELDPDAEMALAEAETQLTGTAATVLCAKPGAGVDF